jgi:pimeloyl-ACP methyl ester carboxylesterase
MVGHSLGGLLVRAFAQHFPHDVVGLVLIDPATEGIPVVAEDDMATKAVVEEMLQKGRANPELWREWYPELFADWDKLPPHVRDPLIARHTDPNHDDAGLRDMMNAARILAEVANGPALPDAPVTVLTGMKLDPTPGRSNSEMEAFNKIKYDAHRTFVNSLPQGEHRVFEDAGHRLPAERPDVVVDAIFGILDRVPGTSVGAGK